jgi:hypothetical protein
MKTEFVKSAREKGATLVESAISLGVLAVAVPLVFAAMGEAGHTGHEAEHDNRSATILPLCLDAVERMRNGTPGCFDPCPAGSPFPPDGEIWALAFAGNGRLAGRVAKEPYQQGLRQLGGTEVAYLARLAAAPQADTSSNNQTLRLTITIEHPANRPAAQRSRSTFQSSVR